jgi:hypothetical protein
MPMKFKKKSKSKPPPGMWGNTVNQSMFTPQEEAQGATWRENKDNPHAKRKKEKKRARCVVM